MTIIHILPGPDVRTPTGKFKDKWCFGCRKRLPHEWVVYSESSPMSYYGPEGFWICTGCGNDDTIFPGCG